MFWRGFSVNFCQKILESKSNKEEEDDKHNRVDIFVENPKSELVLIEAQNSKEYDYLHRILYGTRLSPSTLMRASLMPKSKKLFQSLSITLI